jgi:medium-chain acyl-[acyl-carrier-protein] hydrolase
VQTQSTRSWIVRLKPSRRPRLRLFCFPFAGCGASVYVPWMKQFPDEIEVCAIQLPGREDRIKEQAFTRITQLATAIAGELRHFIQIPFGFFGHSMGATLAFEVSHSLTTLECRPPTILIAGACPAPHVRRQLSTMSTLPRNELLEVLERKRGSSAEVLANQEFIDMILPVLRADLEAVETYCYTDRPPLPCPIVAIGGLSDHEVSADLLDAWREQSTGNFVRLAVAGGHLFVLTQPNETMQVVLQHLRRYLNAL